MKTKQLSNFFKDDSKLYIEHKGTEYQEFPSERRFTVIAYTAYGMGTVIANGSRIHARQRDIFIIPPETGAEFIMDKNTDNPIFEIYFICFDTDFFKDDPYSPENAFSDLKSGGRGYLKVSDGENLEIRNCIVRMINEYYENSPGRVSVLRGCMLILIPLILRRYNAEDKHIFSKNMLVDQTIRQIHSTIYSNPKPHEIAAHRFVTREHLGRVFKKETGMTVTQYINNLRVDIIKDILKNTDRPIEDIPILFNTKLKYLQQTFKQATGITMREYRAKNHYNRSY